MKTSILFRLPMAGLALAFALSGCEVQYGNPDEDSDSDRTPAETTPTTPPANTGGGGGGGGGGGETPTPPPAGEAPAVPRALSPGNGETFAGAGARVTFAWTDAAGAREFELLVQGLGAGGWQTAVRRNTDDFEFTYTLNDAALTQYRWAVRSVGENDQVSDYTGWRSFSWTP